MTAARATIAVWRTFLAAILLPYLVISAILAMHGSVVVGLSGTAATQPADERGILTVLALTLFGYLARSDVLRSREIYADREAVRKGAERSCWAAAARKPRSRTGRIKGKLADLGSSHQSWDLRMRAIDDPAILFVVQPLPIFLVGVAAALTDADLQAFIGFRIFPDSSWLYSPWMAQIITALPAVLVTLVAGVGLWRAVAYARHENTVPPNGLSTGLWLGAGLILGNIVGGQGTIHQLVPQRPEVLMAAIPAATLFTCWTAQCASAWLGKWRGRISTSALSLGLGGGFFIMCWWFAWWTNTGNEFAYGISYSPNGYLRYIKYLYPGPTVHPGVLAVVSWTQLLLTSLSFPPVDLVAVGAAWVVPLVAWTVHAGSRNDSGWLPALKTPLKLAAIGAVATWVCVAWAQLYLHQTRPARPQINSSYDLAYVELLLAAQVLPAAVIAVSTGIQRGRFRLLTALIATEVTVLAGFAGTFVFVSVDGCIRPLATLETSCAWRPGLVTSGDLWRQVFDTTAVLVVGIAFAAYVLGFLRSSVRREDSRAGTSATVPSTGRLRAYRGAAVLGGVAAISIAIAGMVVRFPQQASYPSASQLLSDQVGYAMILPAVESSPAPPRDAAAEITDWSSLGGAGYLSRAQGDIEKIITIGTKEKAANRSHVIPIQYLQDIEPECHDLVTLSSQVRSYFIVPDAKAGPWWSAFVNLIDNGGLQCISAANLLRDDYAQQAASHFRGALALNKESSAQLGSANANIRAIDARISAIQEAGLLADYAAISTTRGPLHVLSPPSDSTVMPESSAFPDTSGSPLGLVSYIKMYYSQSDSGTWKSWEEWYAAHGFISGAGEEWYNADNSVAMIFIARFSSAQSAKSLYSVTAAQYPAKQWKTVADPAVGGAGVIVGASSQTGYAAAQMYTFVGDYQVTVLDYTKSSPDPAAAEALILKQYDSLKQVADLHSSPRVLVLLWQRPSRHRTACLAIGKNSAPPAASAPTVPPTRPPSSAAPSWPACCMGKMRRIVGERLRQGSSVG